MEKKRKRQKNKNDDDDDMDIDDNDEITMEAGPTSEIINADLTLSNIVEENFQAVRSLMKPLFEFEDINPSDIFDVLLFQHEDVGTTLKINDEVFGVFSYIPLTYYKTLKDHNKFIDKFYTYLISKFEKFAKNEEEKKTALDIIHGKSNLGLLINERVFNLPEQAIPPSFGQITKEICECRPFEGYDQRYEFEYLVVVSKFVKILAKDTKGKKRNLGSDHDDSVAYYKFETPLFLQKAIASAEYKIPYKEKNLEYLENPNEPQYINILLIKASDYFDVLEKKLGIDLKHLMD